MAENRDDGPDVASIYIPGPAGIAVLRAAQIARDAAVTAEDAAASAEEAAALSLIQSGVYVDEPTGRAAVADGVAFKVQGSGDIAAYEYRRVNASSSTLIATYPSAAINDVSRANQIVTDTEIVTHGVVTGAVSFSNYTTAYGFLVPYDCTLKQLRVRVANTGTGSIIIARRGAATTGKHTVESITDVTCSVSGVNTFDIANIALRKGDMVMYGVKTGGYLRSDSTSAFVGFSITRPTVIGSEISYTSGVKPAVELSLIKSDRLSAIDDSIAESDARLDVSDSTETLGALTVGTGSPTSLNTWSIGPAAASSITGLLTEVRHGTSVVSGMVSYLVVIYRLVSGTSYTVADVIPVCVMTDASGIATAGLAELGRNIIGVGDRVHVFAPNYASAVAIYTDGAGSGSALSKSTYTVGDAVTLTGAYTNTVRIEYTVEEVASVGYDARITELETQAAPLDMAASSSGTTTPSATWTNHSRAFGHECKTGGLLSSVSVNVAGAGSGEIHHYRKTGGTYTFAQKIACTTSVDGVTEIATDIVVAAGDLIAYATKSGAYIRYNASAEVGFYIEPQPSAVGSTVATTGGARPCVLLTITVPALSEIVADILDLDDRVVILEDAPGADVEIQHSTSLVHESFSGVALPAGWTESGGWTVSNGLVAPGSGGWSTVALSAGYSSLAKRRLTARVQVNDAASVFGICTSPQESNGGAVAMVDGAAGKLRLYSWTGSSTSGTYANEVALPAALVVGRYYMLTAEKDALSSTITFTDTVTQQSCSVTENHDAGYRQFHGRAGVMFLSGAVVFDWFTVDALYPQAAQTVLIGDSNSEGNFLPVGSPSWAYQLAALRSVEGDFVVAPRAGDETPNFEDRKVHDLLPWLPKYVVLSLGTNDTSQATWRTNIAATIAEIEGLGAEPILCTQIPRTAAQALRTAMNADIRGFYFGKYRYIDLALAVSQAHDGVTWDPTYDYGDGIHANAAGQEKMYLQALADAPFLVR